MSRIHSILSVILLTICLALAALPPLQRARADAAGLNPAQESSAVQVAYMIELDAPPAAAYFAQLQQEGVTAAGATAATQRYLAGIEQTQQVLLTTVEASGAPILFRIQRVYNGVAVLATPGQATELANLPGVKAIHRIVSKTPETASSVPFVDAPSLWRGFDGMARVRGEGVRIAVIDTGIDYLHVDFGGAGTGYAQNNRTSAGDAPGFPGAKIIGGYDFAGDQYNANPRDFSYNPIPAPDPDPMDCYGHGTHVAGIAAGFGVTQASATYQGPWNETTDFGGLHIGPGVAPLAQLYALKVFGCTGSSDIVDLAIEWAVDPDGDGDFSDRVDIINMSLGSSLGDLYDTTTVAANNAAALGVIVVASAGNAGDKRFVLGSPSNGDRVISVAATQHRSVQPVDGAPQRIDMIAGFSSRGPRVGDAFLKPDIAAPGVGIASAANASGSGSIRLSGTSMAAPHVAGALALLRQLHPTWSATELKALVMNTAYPLVRAGAPLTATLYAPSLTGAGRIDLPAAARAPAVAYAADYPGRVSLGFGMPEVLDSYSAVQRLRIVDKSGNGAAYLLSYVSLTDMPGVTITLPVTPVMAPANGAFDAPVQISADVAAMGRASPPGAGEVLASGRPWFDEESGHVLLWPVGGSWRATLAGFAGEALQPSVVAGYLPAMRALTYTISLSGATSATVGSISFGVGDPNAVGTKLYTAADVPLSAQITGSLTLDAGHELLLSANEFYIELAIDGEESRILSGQLVTQDAILHVPLHAAPRPVSSMRTTTSTLTPSETLTATVGLIGHALTGSAPPTDVTSLASIFQLELQSPNSRPDRLPDDALDIYDSADISHVGIATDFPNRGREGALLHFGIAAHAPWSSPNLVRFCVLLDVDGDGSSDYRLFNSSREGYVTDQFVGDTFVSVLENLRNSRRVIQAPLNGLPPAVADMRPFGSRVMVLSVRVADLNLLSGQSVISYTVESYHRSLGSQLEDIVDRTSPRRFDLAHPTLDMPSKLQGLPIVEDRPGVTLAPKLDVAGYALQPSKGILIFHHHNGIEEQVGVVELSYRWPAMVYLPHVAR